MRRRGYSLDGENNPIDSSYNITHLNHELEKHIPNSFMRAHILWFQNIRHMSKLKCRKAHNIMNEEKERRCKYFQFKMFTFIILERAN